MTRSDWLPAAAAAVVLAVPLALASTGPAEAGHRHRDDHWGWYGGRHHWHGHHRHWRRHHDGFSATFLFDLTPPPPPRRVIVVPPPVFVQPPPVYVQPPPQAYCREYTSTTWINGQPVETYGTACLQPDGRWRIISRY